MATLKNLCCVSRFGAGGRGAGQQEFARGGHEANASSGTHHEAPGRSSEAARQRHPKPENQDSQQKQKEPSGSFPEICVKKCQIWKHKQRCEMIKSQEMIETWMCKQGPMCSRTFLLHHSPSVYPLTQYYYLQKMILKYLFFFKNYEFHA